jgi:hypothetical protein
MYFMNTLQHKHTEAPKTPVLLDMRQGTIGSVEAVQTVIDAEQAQRLQAVASELGGFSVGILANAGDPYKTIYETDEGKVVTSTTMQVSEGKVIVSMQNTANPNTPANLSPLWQAVKARQ